MAIDKQRLDKFNKDIKGLQKELNFKGHNKVIQANILDHILKANDIPRLRLREWEAVIRPFFGWEYTKYVYETISKTQDSLDIVNHHYQDLGDKIERDIEKISSVEKALKSSFGKYEPHAIHHIARILRKSSVENWNYDQIRFNLKRQSERVDFYADTIARTGIKGISRTAKAEKARIGEVFYYEYVGIIRAETRPFCLAMLGQTRHINIINQMDNGQIKPVLYYCGGYNCHHDLEPDPFFKPPKNEVIRWQTVALYKGKKLKYTLK